MFPEPSGINQIFNHQLDLFYACPWKSNVKIQVKVNVNHEYFVQIAILLLIFNPQKPNHQLICSSFHGYNISILINGLENIL